MSAFTPLPLGRRIPGGIHSVSCSLPTMGAVRGYEEKDPEVMRQLSSGYPRFVLHPLVRQLAAHLAEKHGLQDRVLWLVSSARMAAELQDCLGAGRATGLSADGLHGVSHADTPELTLRAMTFLRNIGGFLSSRAAEDELVRLGLLSESAPEETFAGDAAAEIRRHLRDVFPGVPADFIIPAGCGMNAIYAAFRAAAEVQAACGRTIWIQLGWLYLDTIALLKRFTATPADYVYVRNVFDLAALERLFAENGPRIAGLIAEAPTNPLIQTPDLPAIAALARRHGALLIADPSVSSAFSIDVLPHADLVATSFTKYTASEGDLTAGLVVVNPAAAGAAELQRRIAARIEPVCPRELARLAVEIALTKTVLDRVQRNVPRVVEWLRAHPKVREVFWALHADSRENYLRLARSPGATGSMISFTLRSPIEEFFDRVPLPKGPSFGMQTTLLCPFMYLAHYDLVTTEAGRAELAASGLDPDLLRLSVGTEPVGDLLAALAEGLQ